MGALASAFVDFTQRWMKTGAIAQNPASFKYEWAGIVSTLTDRMNREDDDLYTEFDALAAA